VGGTPVPSAAWRRWAVKSQASVPLPGRAPGAPVFALELTRSRTGPAGARWPLQWRPGGWAPLVSPEETDDAKPFPSLARAALSLPAGGPADEGWRRAG
jgi:hypothetical protein